MRLSVFYSRGSEPSMRCLAAILGVLLIGASASGQVTTIDADAGEPLLAVRADTMGRLFVGGRESLFVYEPDGKGGFRPRQRLYRFPADTEINAKEIRGNDLYVATRSAIYVIADGVHKRDGLKPTKLLWGVPRGDARQGFRALAWG